MREKWESFTWNSRQGIVEIWVGSNACRENMAALPPPHPQGFHSARLELESFVETITVLESNTITKDRRKAWSTLRDSERAPWEEYCSSTKSEEKTYPAKLSCLREALKLGGKNISPPKSFHLLHFLKLVQEIMRHICVISSRGSILHYRLSDLARAFSSHRLWGNGFLMWNAFQRLSWALVEETILIDNPDLRQHESAHTHTQTHRGWEASLFLHSRGYNILT